MTGPDDYSHRFFISKRWSLVDNTLEYTAPDGSTQIFHPVRTCPLCTCPTTRQRVELDDYERLLNMAKRGNLAALYTLRRIAELPGHINSPVCGGCLLLYPAPRIIIPK